MMQTSVVVPQPEQEPPAARKLNIASAILSSILLIFTIVVIIYGRISIVPYYAYLGFVTFFGSAGAIPFLIGMILSLVSVFSTHGSKRNTLTGAIVAYSIAVCTMFSWAAIAIAIVDWMHSFLVVGFGCIALVIMSSISCSMYSDVEGTAVIIAAAPTVAIAAPVQPMLPAQPCYAQPLPHPQLQHGYSQKQAYPPGYAQPRPGFPHSQPSYPHNSGYAQGQPGYVTQGPPGYAQGQSGYAQGPPGYAQGQSGYAQGQSGYAQGPPGYAQGQSGYAQGQPSYSSAQETSETTERSNM